MGRDKYVMYGDTYVFNPSVPYPKFGPLRGQLSCKRILLHKDKRKHFLKGSKYIKHNTFVTQNYSSSPVNFFRPSKLTITVSSNFHLRLNTGMAPTCNWMIKIVKVNKLYLNSLLVSIVNRVSQSGTMKYQCEWKHRCIKQEMVTYVAKGR